MIPIKDIMTKDVVYVHPETPIYEALTLLINHKISGMPVVDQDINVVGILSEKDFLRILIDKRLDVRSPVKNYMSREVICFTEDDNPIDICKFFLKSYIRRVPIVNQGKLVGVISRRDIVSLILEAKSKISDFRFD